MRHKCRRCRDSGHLSACGTDNTQDFDAIIGCMFTEQPYVEYRKSSDELISTKRGDALLTDIELSDDIDATVNATLQAEIIRPPAVMQFIHVMSDNNWCLTWRGPWPPAEWPLAVINIDYTDLSMFLQWSIAKDSEVQGAIRALEKLVNEIGASRKIISDWRTCFTPQRFTEFCKKHGIDHLLNSPSHLQANG